MTILKVGRPSIKKEQALKQLENKKNIMAMNIKIDKGFHKEVKRYALEHDMTVTELIHLSLQDYIKK